MHSLGPVGSVTTDLNKTLVCMMNCGGCLLPLHIMYVSSGAIYNSEHDSVGRCWEPLLCIYEETSGASLHQHGVPPEVTVEQRDAVLNDME